MTYNERVDSMSETLARISVAEMDKMAKDQGIERSLGGDYDQWPDGAKRAALGAHNNRAKAAVAAQAEAIRHYDSLTSPGKWDVEKFLQQNGYIEVV